MMTVVFPVPIPQIDIKFCLVPKTTSIKEWRLTTYLAVPILGPRGLSRT